MTVGGWEKESLCNVGTTLGIYQLFAVKWYCLIPYRVCTFLPVVCSFKFKFLDKYYI